MGSIKVSSKHHKSIMAQPLSLGAQGFKWTSMQKCEQEAPCQREGSFLPALNLSIVKEALRLNEQYANLPTNIVALSCRLKMEI